MPHQYQATIDLIKNVIHRLPGIFPEARHREIEAELMALERDPSASLETIEGKLIAAGAELWAYCEAYDKFYKIYGEKNERALMRQKLSEPARAALDKFVAEGGNIESVRDGSRFEHFFDADIRDEIVEAELAAHDGVHEEMEKLLAGEKQNDFSILLADYQEKQKALAKKIDELAALAGRMPNYSAEILDKVKTYREGFAYVEKLPSLQDIAQEIQYYIDIMEV